MRMCLVSVREVGAERPWLQFGLTDFMWTWDAVRAAVEQDERDPALQYVQYDNKGHWWPLVDEPTERDILARMVARLKSESPANARMDAVDELIELGRTTPEAWKLVWDAMPVEAADDPAAINQGNAELMKSVFRHFERKQG